MPSHITQLDTKSNEIKDHFTYFDLRIHARSCSLYSTVLRSVLGSFRSHESGDERREEVRHFQEVQSLLQMSLLDAFAGVQ
eukprot:m.270419 g.270419  ORF g.270419 m.270419 type:complete len:81 (-) comp15680_c1_seq3:454-696(-)